MPPSLLPQEIAPVDDRQAALTQHHLAGRLTELHDYFLALRAEVDRTLAPALPPAGGKPYPYGRCEEITRTLLAELAQRLNAPSHRMDAALRAFLADGGMFRSLWGALRGQYFQNALQLGGLYVDVSNDTVVVTKPKVEILPLAESGLESIRSLDHFRRIAEIYWGASLWANVLAPSLAPLLPMVSASPGRLAPGLQSASDYMIGLMCRDGFHQAEAWLRDAAVPPPDVAAGILAALPADLRPATADGRGEAVQACRAARAAGHQAVGRWRDDRVRDYLRLMAATSRVASGDHGA